MTRFELLATMAATIAAGLRSQESNTELAWGRDELATAAVRDAEAIMRVIDERTPEADKMIGAPHHWPIWMR